MAKRILEQGAGIRLLGSAAAALALAAGLSGAARAWDNIEEDKSGAEGAYSGGLSMEKLREEAAAAPGIKGAEEQQAALDPAAVRFCHRYDDGGPLSSILHLTDHCLRFVADRSFDPKALGVCAHYDSYFPEKQCLGIIAGRSFDPAALDVCDRRFDSAALTNQCLEVIAQRSDPKTMEAIDICGRYVYWREKSDRWKSKCLSRVSAGQPVSETEGLKEKDDLKIGSLGLKRWLVGALPDPLLDAYLEAKFRLEGNLGSGYGWEHQRRFEDLKARYLRELEEGRKLRKYE